LYSQNPAAATAMTTIATRRLRFMGCSLTSRGS
jgi:hypothetical protein